MRERRTRLRAPDQAATLERAFADIAAIPTSAHANLRLAVSAFAEGAKRASIPIEDVIISLKGIARRALARAGVDDAEMDDVIALSVTWCIEHYY